MANDIDSIRKGKGNKAQKAWDSEQKQSLPGLDLKINRWRKSILTHMATSGYIR